MDITALRRQMPELAGLDDNQVVDVLHQTYYADLPREQVAGALGIKPVEPAAGRPVRSVGDVAGDAAISLLKGAIAVPEAGVGLADMASGGRLGKQLEEWGYRPAAARGILDDWYSDAQKAAFQEVQNADGVVDTVGAAVRNPSVIVHSALESLPSIGAGGVVGRGAVALAPRLGAVGAAALGEGVVQAGSAAEQTRQQTDDGLLTGKQALAAGASGVGTGLLGLLGGKVAAKLGISDVDTMLVGASASPQVRQGVVRTVLEGAVSEGLLEELPQSVQEQMWQNYALGKPLDEGVDQAAVLGALTGGLMGGAAGPIHRPKLPEVGPLSRGVNQAPDEPAPAAPAVNPVPDGGAAAPAGPSLAEAIAAAERRRPAPLDGVLTDLRTPQPAATLPLLTYDQTPTGVMLAGEQGVRPQTRADAINALQEQARLDAERQRLADLGLTPDVIRAPRTPVQEVAQDAAGEASARPAPSVVAPTEPAAAVSQQAETQAAARPEPRPDAVPQPSQQERPQTGPFATAQEAQQYISQQRRAASANLPPALPRQMPDGSFGVVSEGDPAYAQAQAEQRQRDLRAAGVLEGDVLTASGGVFKTKGSAVTAAKKRGGTPVQVQGGWVVRKEAADVGDQGGAGGLAAGGRDGAGRDAAAGVAGTGPDPAELRGAGAGPNGSVAGDGAAAPVRDGAGGSAAAVSEPAVGGTPAVTEAPQATVQDEPAPKAEARTAPRVSELGNVAVGPGSIRPQEIAPGKRLYRETSTSGLEDLLREDGLTGVRKMFVTDNPDLAIGQGDNVGVQVTFREGSLSGREHLKPGTGELAGREYVTDVVAPQAIESFTVPAGFNPAKLRGLARRSLVKGFERTELPDGRIRYVRKGAKADDAPSAAPDTQEAQPPVDQGRPGAEVETTATAAPITDVGEKIGGARKDLWRQRGLAVGDLDTMSEAEGATVATKANVWKPDYAAMAAEGSNPVHLALLKGVYDQLAAKPKENTPAGRRRYVRMMQLVREIYPRHLQGADPVQQLRAARDELHERLGLRNKDDRAAYEEARKTLFSVYKGRTEPFSLWTNDLQRAKQLLQQGFPAATEPWTRRLVVRQQAAQGLTPRGREMVLQAAEEAGTPLSPQQLESGYFEVRTKDGKTLAYLPSEDDAKAAAKALYERMLADGRDDAQEPARPHLDKLVREGMAGSIDRDVSADELMSAHGFRGVEFGNWAVQDERQKLLNLAYDSLGDLATILNVPRKALSLNGTLGLAFGARGGGRFAAHYEPGKLVINMTKLRGAGALAHEWAHGLDHYLGELDRADAYKTEARGASGWYTRQAYDGRPAARMVSDGKGGWQRVEARRLENLRPELATAIDGVMQEIFTAPVPQQEAIAAAQREVERARQLLADRNNDPDLAKVYRDSLSRAEQALADARAGKIERRKESDFSRQADKLNGKAEKGYWSRPTEMFARAFESYVFDKITAMGARSDYLVHGVEGDRFDAPSFKGNPYPSGEDRARINAAFDRLVQTLKTRETDQGVALFSRSAPAFTEQVDAVLDGKRPESAAVRVSGPLPVATALGMPALPVVTTGDRLAKMHFEHGLTRSDIRALPEHLARPVMVFESASQPGSMVFVLDAWKNGRPVLAAIRPNVVQDRLEVNLLASAYPKDKPEMLGQWFRDGLLRYADKEKTRAWATSGGVQFPWLVQLRRGSSGKVLGPADVVNMGPAFSRAAPDEAAAIKALAENDDLFALPRSDKDTVEGITADVAPWLTVRKDTSTPGVTQYVFTLPDGNTGTMSVRPFNPYGQSVYGYDLVDGEMTNVVTERPGENADAVGEKDDVWIDVSKLKGQGEGTAIYAVAANYAHNTGRVFIGDPAGLSDEAMRRRSEHMLSSALKFGTTEHLAPHPRQVAGDPDIGVPPLRWVYGDDLGNIRSLIDVNLKAVENAGYDASAIGFDPGSGRFRSAGQAALSQAEFRQAVAAAGLARAGQAGGRALARAAVLQSLAREEGQGDGGGDGQRDGLLARLVRLSAVHPEATRRLFYSRGAGTGGTDARVAAVQAAVDRLKAGWANAPEIVVLPTFDAAPAVVRAANDTQESRGAAGAPEGFYWGGKAYVVASEIGSANLDRDVARVVMHEVLGHHGLRGAFGDQLSGILKQLAAVRRSEVAAKAEQYGLDMEEARDRRMAAEEVLAEMAQTNPQLGFVRRAVAAIRSWLRQNFKRFADLRVTDDEIIRSYILPARGFVERGRAARAGVLQPAFARAGDDAPSFSRVDQQAIRNRFVDAVTAVRDSSKSVGVWGKTVGTQYAKAKEHPETFGKVFNALQNYVQDISRFANEAADRAPDLLPKLDTWRDLARTGAKPADLKAVAAPVFLGTLEDGKVYTDAELSSRFGLTDHQRQLYRQFRAAVDQSLDDVGKADMVRLAGADGAAVREQALAGTAAEAAGVLADHLREQAQQAGEQRAARLEQLAQDIEAKQAQIQKLKDEGYAPLMRFGRYTLHITQGGQTQYFGLYETERDAVRAQRELKGDPAFAGSTFERGVMSQEAFKLFGGVPLDSLELFAQASGLEQSEVYQDYLRLTKSNRSALKRLIQRKGIAGFSEDVSRVLASFLTSNARLASANLHMGEAKQAAEAIPKQLGDVKDEAVKLIDYVQNPQEEAAAMRGLLFVNFIGGSVASAAVNLTQPLTMTLPYLSQWGGVGKATARLLAGAKAAAGGRLADPQLRQALKRAEEEGIVSPQEIHQLQAEASAALGKHPLLKKAGFIWGALFSLSEQFNRRVTFIAAYQTAQAEGVADPFKFAEEAVIETQGLYNKANKPNWARGAIGATAMTFKQFSIHYLEFLRRMWTSGPQGKKAVGVAVAMLLLAAGAQGLPFADDLDDLIDTLAQALGYDFSSKDAKRRFIAETLGLGDTAALVATRGLSAIPGVPIDVSIRMGMGNLLPATGILMRSNTDRSRDLLEVAGAGGALVKAYMDAGQKALQGDAVGAIRTALPTAFRNMWQAVEMYQSGEYRDSLGRKVRDVTPGDAAVKFIGFQPAEVAQESDKIGTANRSIQLAKNVEAEITGRWAQGLFEQDADLVARAREDLRAWNEKNPDSPIRITMPQVMRRVREMRRSRADRFVRSAPKEMRGRIQEAIQ